MTGRCMRGVVWGILLIAHTVLISGDNIVGTLTTKAHKQGFLTVSDIPGIRSVTIPNPLKKLFSTLQINNPVIEQQDVGVRIRGTTVIQGANVEVTALIKAGFAGLAQLSPDGAIRASLGVFLPTSLTFADLTPALRVLDKSVNFSRIGLIVTSYDYQDDDWNLWMETGVNLVGTVIFAPRSSVATVVPGINRLDMQTVLTPDIAGSALRGIWPVQLILADGVKTTDITLAIEIPEENTINTGPTFVIETGLMVDVPKQKNPLEFRTAWTFGTLGVKIEGAMDGMWRNPMGIKGIALGDVGIEGDISYVATGAGIPLTGLGLRGAIAVGSKKIAVGGLAKVDEEVPFGQTVFFGQLEGGLYLTDIAALVSSMIGAPIPVDQLPTLGFDDIHIYIAPTGGELAEKTFQAGVTIAGTFKIGDATATLDLHANDTGARGFGHISPLSFGPLSITGAGPDTKKGTDDDGAVINLQLDGKKQAFFIDGVVELALLGGLTAQGHVDIAKKGLAVKTVADAFGMQLYLIADLPWSRPESGRVRGAFAQTSLDQCARYLEQAARAIVNSATKSITKETARVQEEIKKLEAKIKKKKKSCKKLNISACAELVPLGTQLVGYYIHEKVSLRTALYESRGVAKLASALASATGNVINVREISFDAQVSELKSARLPRVKVKATIFGIDIEQTMQLDLQDMASWTVQIVEQCIDKL